MSTNKSSQGPMERQSQYGGVGGGQSPFAPGGSPMGRGYGSGGGLDINKYVVDESFDAVLEQVHNPAPIDPERNIEKRLEEQHVFAEENAIPYDLSFEERQRLKIRNEIRRREQFYEDAAKSIAKNSPSYIQNNFQPSESHITPFNVLLQSRRKNNDESYVRDPREDDIPPQIKPTRYHPVLSSNGHDRLAYLISRPNEINDEDSDEVNWANKARVTFPLGLGSTPVLNLGSELDEYLDQVSKQNWGGQKSTSNEPSVGFDFHEPDEFTLLHEPDTKNLPSSIGELAEDVVNGMGRLDKENDYGIVDSPFVTLEAKLEATNRAEPERSPSDVFPGNKWQLHKDEPTGILDSYQQKFEGQGSPWKI